MDEGTTSVNTNDQFSNNQLDESTLPSIGIIEYSPLEKNLLKANLIWVTLFFSFGILIVLFLQYVIKIERMNSFGHWILLGLMGLGTISALITYF